MCRCGTKLVTATATEAAPDREVLSPSDLADAFGVMLGVVAFMVGMLVVVYWLGRKPVRAPHPPPTLLMKSTPPASAEEPAAVPRGEPIATPGRAPAATSTPVELEAPSSKVPRSKTP